MSKHTPGPWVVFKDDKDGAVEVMAGPECIAYIYRARRNNAALIAAAPELLEALKNLCNCLEDSTDHCNPETGEPYGDYDYAMSIIKKAEGES
jgi:hypothetical protein